MGDFAIVDSFHAVVARHTCTFFLTFEAKKIKTEPRIFYLYKKKWGKAVF
jgi:hypothetical protein